MTRDEQEMALWREAYCASRLITRAGVEAEADAAVDAFRKRYPLPQTQTPPAVWYDEPPFSRDCALQPCWIAGDGRVFVGAVYWDHNEWRVYPMGERQSYPLAGRRVCPITLPQEPTT